jgi:transcriptional antiterminator RfaH
MTRWYLVHTKPAAEGTARSNLERQGYEVYFPQLARTVRRVGARKDTVAPLFPRYVFVRVIEGSQSLSPIRSTLGVANVVRFGFDYAVVPLEVIRDLKAHADPITGLHRLKPQALARGAQVRIADGAFRGLEGVFERGLGADRVLVLLTLLGQSTSVDVPFDFVVPVRATGGAQR